MTQPVKLIANIFLLSLSFPSFAQKSKEVRFGTSSYSQQSVTIQGKDFIGFLTSEGFQLLDSKYKLLIKHSGDYCTWEFKDFNKDGYKDIYLGKSGNIPERFDLLLYAPTTKSFRQVKDFENFPAPENISGTKYFYSYHKSGCADMNWDSDLFYIKGFETIKLANISGRECENSGVKDGLYISKFRGNEKNLVKTLPIDTVHKFNDAKWGFIKKYWTENYKHFL